MRSFRRSERVSASVQHILSEVLGREVRDPRVSKVVITSVQMNDDLRIATVQFQLLGLQVEPDSPQVKEALVGLEAAKGYLRRELGDPTANQVHSRPSVLLRYVACHDDAHQRDPGERAPFGFMRLQSGILLMDKPLDITSAGLVREIERRVAGLRCGHLGTLDPMASGLLVVLLGHAVKMTPYYLHGPKRYVATIRFGEATETYDSEGEVVTTAPVPEDLPARLQSALSASLGEQMQVPPIYSAIKKGGKRLYDLARRGRVVEPEPRKVTFHALQLAGLVGHDAVVDVSCSSGTYIRSLAYDLGRACGTVAHLAGLRRLESAPFSVEGAIPFEKVMDPAFDLESAALSLESFPCPGRKLVISDAQALKVLHGVGVPHPDGQGPVGESWTLFTQAGVLFAMAEAGFDGTELNVKRVIRPDVELPAAN